MAKCIRCDTELVATDNDYLDDVEVKSYLCPHCGTIHNTFLTTEEGEEFPINNEELREQFIDCHHGYDGCCTECGMHIIWSGDFMRSEVYGDVDESEEMMNEYGFSKDDSLVSNVFCPYCGAQIEVVEPRPSDYKDYPAYADIVNKE